MVPVGITGYSHQGVPYYPQVSSFDSLKCIQSLCFSFFTTCSSDWHPGSLECLGSSQEWSQESYALFVHYGAKQRLAWFPSPPTPVQ